MRLKSIVFIKNTETEIDSFPIDGNFVELFNKLVVLLHAFTLIFTHKDDYEEYENYEDKFKKLADFHEYIYKRYEAAKDIIAYTKLKYFGLYGNKSYSIKRAILDDEV